jgi:tRNA1Val (adenine37-N6)-methyltransferase
VCTDFCEFAHQQNVDSYHLIVSNPPYFHHSLLPTDAARSQARHATTLTHAALFAAARRLLTPDGRLAVILPCSADILPTAASAGLYPARRTPVLPNCNKPAKRILLEFALTPTDCAESELTLQQTTPPYGRTEKYRELTEDFYL